MASAAEVVDTKLRFAKAVGVRADTLSEFQRIVLPKGGAIAEAWVGIGEVSGDPQPWLVPLSAAGVAGAALRLPIASKLALMARIDLAGPPLKIDLSAPPVSADSGAAAKGGAVPALLLRAAHKLDGGEQRETLVLVSLGKSPALVWSEIASSIRPRQEGFRSFALELVADPGQPWLALHLFQTTVPAAGQQPAMPGPPLLLQFGYRGDAYRRIG